VYAAECAARDEPEDCVAAAVERLASWFAGSVVAAQGLPARGLGDIDLTGPENPPMTRQAWPRPALDQAAAEASHPRDST
jgi:hypothetical protein